MRPHDRYKDKPLLRIIESYILRCLCVLSKDDESKLIALESDLQMTYKKSGKWHEIVADVMQLPENFDQYIIDLWHENSAIAVERGVELTPQTFSEMVVDDNFM